MKLSDKTDHSLRALMYMNQVKRRVTLTEISEKLNLSRNSLIKIANQLNEINLIVATRGKNGGLEIHKTAGKKSIKEIILKTEPNFHIAECFSDNSSCTLIKGCQLKKALKHSYQAFLDSLASTTLDDITPSGPV